MALRVVWSSSGRVGQCMQLLPMDIPAEIHRWVRDEGHPGQECDEVIVARGPLVIMAHGLCAIEPALRSAFFITSEAGNLNAQEAQEVLRVWSSRAEGAGEEE